MTDENMKRQGGYVRLSESVVKSNRWNLLEEKITSSDLNVFITTRQRQVFLELLSALRTEYERLKHDYYKNKYSSRSSLAWYARNLLEINTWFRFCCEDVENAEILYHDAGKDQLDLEENLERWGRETNQPPEFFEEINRKKQAIFYQAEKRGLCDLDSKYTAPSKVAKRLNHDKTYRIHNKILSKFAHPTAMMLFSRETPEEESKRAFYFFSQGCLFFYDAFSRLETFIE